MFIWLSRHTTHYTVDNKKRKKKLKENINKTANVKIRRK